MINLPQTPDWVHDFPPSVIIVLGQTASGKSSFAIELAKLLGSIVICSDAFQVYRDFSVATDKILPEEMDGVPHYGFDLVDAGAEFTVKDFLDYTVPLIDFELKKGRSPIIVGGTHMYIEKLLYTSRLDESPKTVNSIQRSALNPSVSLHAELSSIDPLMATRLHPNDTRRVCRAIEFFYDNNIRLSDKLMNQNRVLRYENTIVLCKRSKSNLEERIRNRIKIKMLNDNKLLDELTRINLQVEEKKMVWNRGLLQAIGYKEFDPSLNQSFQQGVDAMILHTIQYSKKQEKWIRRIKKNINVFDIENLMDMKNVGFSRLLDSLKWSP